MTKPGVRVLLSRVLKPGDMPGTAVAATRHTQRKDDIRIAVAVHVDGISVHGTRRANNHVLLPFDTT